MNTLPTHLLTTTRRLAPWCAALLMTACGGGGAPPAPPVVPTGAGLVRAQSGELTRHLADRVRARGGQGSPLAAGTEAAPAPAPAADSARSGTLLQESGVDEDDLLKAAGDSVYSLHANTVRRDRLAADGRLQREAELALAAEPDTLGGGFSGLYLTEGGTRTVALGTSWTMGEWQGGCGAEVCPALGLIMVVPTVPKVLLQPLNTSIGLAAEARIRIDGRLVGSRRLGQQLVVVSTHQPALAVDALPVTATSAEREAAIAALTASDLLPRLQVGTADPVPLVAETDCYLQPGNASPAVEITTVTVFDLNSPTLAHTSRCFAGGSEALYMAADALYLATTRWAYAGTPPVVYAQDMGTDLHKFSIGGGVASYRASGSVNGHLGWDSERKSSRLSEWNGHLRVLSFTGATGWATASDAGNPATPPSPATLTVLREEAGQLLTVASLPNAQRPEAIGKPGEQIQGVRFVEDRAYVVTFRQVDPLYVLDLANPADPRTVGVLEVPGFSQDLYAMGPGWLLGVGREADSNGLITGLKVALFDVRNPAQPLLHSSQTAGGPGSSTALDHSRHGLNLLWRDGVARIGLPMLLWDGNGWQQGLQRIEVTPASGSLVFKPLLPHDPPLAMPDVATDRSLQIGDQVLYLSQGQLGAWAW
ncbi:MAG: beta-propeller domain-containing protein [Rubrivivax sp.]|nr:beta-propeller domain-containing protein [Rubrivivax sp.]